MVPCVRTDSRKTGDSGENVKMARGKDAHLLMVVGMFLSTSTSVRAMFVHVQTAAIWAQIAPCARVPCDSSVSNIHLRIPSVFMLLLSAPARAYYSSYTSRRRRKSCSCPSTCLPQSSVWDTKSCQTSRHMPEETQRQLETKGRDRLRMLAYVKIDEYSCGAQRSRRRRHW